MKWRILGRLWTIWAYLLLRSGLWLGQHVPEGNKSNCYLWAFGQLEEGDTLVLVQSKFGPWFHCILQKKNGEMWEFNPPSKCAVWTTPCRQLWQGWIQFFKTFPPLIFHGKAYQVKNGNH